MSWGQVGREILLQMDKPNADFKKIAEVALNRIYDAYPGKFPEDVAERKKALGSISREILKKYPRQRDKTSNYYHDPKGKESLAKWRHNIFQWLTLDQKDWDNLHPTANDTTVGKTSDAKTEKSTENTTLTFDKMIEKLPAEIKEMAQATMDSQGIDWQELIEKSLNQYCRGYVERVKAVDDVDLTKVSTEELLENSSYRTHPKRSKELTRRAIAAIKEYNENQPDIKLRWMISASIVGQLIKSKTTTVREAMEDFRDDVETHNSKYGFKSMHNRGKGNISDFIDIVAICPTGE